jgi:hypothetical protein
VALEHAVEDLRRLDLDHRITDDHEDTGPAGDRMEGGGSSGGSESNRHEGGL